jgi:solute carrier family 39 (zinc transporter), member 1/2/3
MSEEEVNACTTPPGSDSYLGLRIGAVFIIWAGSTTGALFPVLARRSSWLNVPKSAFEYVRAHIGLSDPC